MSPVNLSMTLLNSNCIQSRTVSPKGSPEPTKSPGNSSFAMPNYNTAKKT